jgi:hypothetical protein
MPVIRANQCPAWDANNAISRPRSHQEEGGPDYFDTNDMAEIHIPGKSQNGPENRQEYYNLADSFNSQMENKSNTSGNGENATKTSDMETNL